MRIDDLMSDRDLPRLTPNTTALPLTMTPKEAYAFLDVLLEPSPVTAYIEWGSGGSTSLVSWLALNGTLPRNLRAVSVDSSPKHQQHTRVRSSVARRAEQRGIVTLLTSSYGAEKAHGHPAESARFHSAVRSAAAKYVAAPFTALPQSHAVEVALIDGRFRVACALEVLKHASPTTRILMHDYGTKDHAEYSHILNYYVLMRQVGTLAMFSPRADRFGRFDRRDIEDRIAGWLHSSQ
jgi:hypothetical protein